MHAMSRAHYFVLDLFYDFSALVSRVGVQGLGPVRGSTLAEMLVVAAAGGAPLMGGDARGESGGGGQG
jgi:hypothetical protein